MKNQLDFLFKPKSIAIIGASRSRNKVGYQILNNLKNSGFRGEIFPINPNTNEISGKKVYPSVSSVEKEIDLAVIAVPGKIVPGIFMELAGYKVKTAIVISSGFREIGLQGKILEDNILQICRSNNIKLLGPNCMGIISPAHKLNVSFGPDFNQKGNISFISQSGALGSAILEWARGEKIGLANFISLGNKADISENDLLSYLETDPDTEVLALYLESLSNGRDFYEIVSRISRKKPVVVFKSGKTIVGKLAAVSHTGALSGESAIFSSAMKQAGVIEAQTIEDFFLFVKSFSLCRKITEDSVTILTNAGGPAVVASDALVKSGFSLNKFSKDTIDKLHTDLPQLSITNPFDVLGNADERIFGTAGLALISDPKVKNLLFIITPQKDTPIQKISEAIASITRLTTKPILLCSMGGKKLKEGNFPVFTYPEEAVRFLSTAYEFYQHPRMISKPITCRSLKTEKIINSILSRYANICSSKISLSIPEIKAFEIAKDYNLPVCETELVETVSAALAFLKKYKNIALKVSSPTILHRNRVSGVKLNLLNENETIKAYHRLLALNGTVVASEMASPGAEIIIGTTIDSDFGRCLMFGTGGVNTQDYNDVAFLVLPASRNEIKSLFERTVIGRILREKGQELNVLDILLAVSCIMENHPQIKEININPLIIGEDSVKIVDIKITV